MLLLILCYLCLWYNCMYRTKRRNIKNSRHYKYVYNSVHTRFESFDVFVRKSTRMFTTVIIIYIGGNEGEIWKRTPGIICKYTTLYTQDLTFCSAATYICCIRSPVMCVQEEMRRKHEKELQELKVRKHTFQRLFCLEYF